MIVESAFCCDPAHRCTHYKVLKGCLPPADEMRPDLLSMAKSCDRRMTVFGVGG